MEIDKVDNHVPDGDSQVTATQHRQTERLMELAVVLLFIVPGSILANFARHPGGSSFVVCALGVIAHNVALVCLVRFFVWRNRESIREVGWNFDHLWKEALLGLAFFVPLFVGAALIGALLQAIGLGGATSGRPAFLLGHRGWDSLLALVMVIVVAFSEESIYRGYLISRMRAISPNLATIVLLSSTVFAIGHGYEGPAGMITVGFVGVVFAVIYLWRGSLVAPIAMHFLQDFVAIVALPYINYWAGQ